MNEDIIQGLLNEIGKLSMKINMLESSLREFEKQRVIPLRERIEKLEIHHKYQIDENRKISRRVDEIEEEYEINL